MPPPLLNTSLGVSGMEWNSSFSFSLSRSLVSVSRAWFEGGVEVAGSVSRPLVRVVVVLVVVVAVGVSVGVSRG